MKAIALLVTATLLGTHSFAQDTLTLKIPALSRARIVLQQGNTIFEPEASLTVDSTTWLLHVAPAAQGAKVVIKNNEGGDSTVIDDFSNIFTIRNDTVLAKNFKLGKNFRLKVVRQNGAEVKGYDIEYSIILRDGNLSRGSNRNGNGNGGDDGYKPGSLIYDALYLAGDNSTNAEKYKILSFYAGGEDDPVKLDSIYKGNGFLKSLGGVVLNKGNQQSGGGLSSVFASIGGLDVTKIADGAAKFLVKRVKQELSIAFFERFKKIVDSTKDLQTLFPQTVNLLDAIDTEIYNYERYIQNLREAFKEDIEVIHRNLPGIVDNHPAFFTKYPELKAALLSGCYIATELEDQAHPGDILANYPVEYLDGFNKNYKGAVQTIQLISASLRDTSTAEDATYWVAIKHIRELVNNKTALKYYLGLVYQEAIYKYDSVAFETTNLKRLLNVVAANYDKGVTVYNAYKRYVLRFGEKINALNEMVEEYGKLPADSAKLEKYATYFRTAVDLIEYCTQVSALPLIKGNVPNLDSLLRKYFDIAYSVTDLVIDISKKNYSSAINHLVHIYNVVRVKPSKDSLKTVELEGNTLTRKEQRAIRSYNKSLTQIERLTGNNIPDTLKRAIDTTLQRTIAIANGRVTQERIILDSIKNQSDSSATILNRLVRYGTFMATVATAKNSDEVANAIETAALPVGSSRIKRESMFNVSLNAYVGPYIGFEKIRGVDSGKLNAYGITAPIGISISKGNSILFFKSGTRSSSSIFFSLFDIGAVTAFRFTNDSTEKVPAIELKDIISPGIFYSHGFGKTPLSFNIGYQLGPLLRKVNLDENKFSKSYSRFSISLCVDIPVFNLYNRSR